MQLKLLILFFLLSFAACNDAQVQGSKNAKAKSTTTIYLVRHAEKADGENPPLTELGKKRANDLADLLADKGITDIYSTDYLRTQQTAAPTAQKVSRGVGSYSPNNLNELADKIRKQQGVVLVVGHSNTTPELVKILGGDPGTPINEAYEYDRLYELKLNKGKVISSNILQYGAVTER